MSVVPAPRTIFRLGMGTVLYGFFWLIALYVPLHIYLCTVHVACNASGVVCSNYGYMYVFLVCVCCKLLGEDVEWWSGWESGGVCFGEWRRKGAVGEPDMYCLVWELAWQEV